MRLVAPLAVGLATLILAAPALAADMDSFGSGDGLRSGYSDQWDNSDSNDPLSFEFGLRYWYSLGAQSFSIGTGDHGTMTVNDQSQSAEAHFRIDDSSTRTYVKGLAGMAFSTEGSSTDDGGTVNVTNGKINYLGADIGYSWLRDSKSGASFGPFAGYMFWNDSPNTYADNYTTAKSAADITFDQTTGQTSFPGASQPNDIEMNMIRLGFSGKAKLGDMFDISGEVAAVPYSRVDGVLGAGSGAAVGSTINYVNPNNVAESPSGVVPGTFNIHGIQSSPTTLSGWGYGGMGEAMIGFHPSSNLTFRLGGRAWYVQGTTDAMFSRAVIGDPTNSNPPDPTTPAVPADPTATPPVVGTPAVPHPNSPNFDTGPTFSNQDYITRANPFSIFRYGILAEMTYSF